MYLCGKLDSLSSKKKVLHSCDNPACVNPFHLFIGTQKDNVRDMHAKGRNKIGSSPGEKNSHAKLTWQDVAQIRELACNYSWGLYAKIARQYGVHTNTICDIVSGKKWKTE